MKLPNIKYAGDISKFVEAADDPFEFISYRKDIDYFSDMTNFVSFVKDVEVIVRGSKEYSFFVETLKKVYGLNFCQVFSNVVSDVGVTVEMHHGPIFTLFDIIAVITNHYIKRGYTITIMRIADKVIDLHYEGLVQVVMLAKTSHEAVHNRDIFLNVNQGFGNLDAFIKRYTGDLEDEQKYKIWNYINLCKSNQSFDTGILDVDHIKKFVKLD